MSNFVTVPADIWKRMQDAAAGKAKPSFEVMALKAEINALRTELAKLKGEKPPAPIK